MNDKEFVEKIEKLLGLIYEPPKNKFAFEEPFKYMGNCERLAIPSNLDALLRQAYEQSVERSRNQAINQLHKN